MDPVGERLALFERERAGLTRLAHVITGSNQVAEDVVHDAFLRWVDREDVTNPAGYLRTVVANLAKHPGATKPSPPTAPSSRATPTSASLPSSRGSRGVAVFEGAKRDHDEVRDLLGRVLDGGAVVVGEVEEFARVEQGVPDEDGQIHPVIGNLEFRIVTDGATDDSIDTRDHVVVAAHSGEESFGRANVHEGVTSMRDQTTPGRTHRTHARHVCRCLFEVVEERGDIGQHGVVDRREVPIRGRTRHACLDGDLAQRRLAALRQQPSDRCEQLRPVLDCVRSVTA